MPAQGIPTFFPLAEVAGKLHVTPRRLKEHLCGRRIGRKLGRQVLFTEADVLCIIASLEIAGPVGVPTLKRRAVPRASFAGAHVSDAAMSEALTLALEKPRPKPSRRARRRAAKAESLADGPPEQSSASMP